MSMKTNEVQRAYMVAKAHYQALEQELVRMEKAYIDAHGIRNPDGSVPSRIYCILDETVFDRANEESCAEITACGLEADLNEARKMLNEAEDAMVDYGISIAPASMREALKTRVSRDYTARKKMIDMVFSLDVSTVPKQEGR